MQQGILYFIKDELYDRFKHYGLLTNKEQSEGKSHGRPCCYLFKYDEINTNIYWMVPISSQVSKYQKEFNHSIDKYGICDNISFGFVLGAKRAFLPQNVFPVTCEYIDGEYIDKNTNKPITIKKSLMAELNAKVRKKIRYNKTGKPFGLTDVWGIYNELMKDISL